MECEQCKLLALEIEKLKKQINLKNKKISKLRKQKDDYLEEIDSLDIELAAGMAVVEDIKSDSRCPKCNQKLEEIRTALGFCILVCEGCNYRRTE